ncbi:diguanylate cyclase domain-containing protein [Paenibacillus silvisoli]|uniref:diguanylate cyclase domain-containing protein n=1 Tax=Paenibacillus silvisoli TaxID=3110539 RepID=UPI002803C6FF|nr:diguanylate cyclase [Paenibacillus silvisoli]
MNADWTNKTDSRSGISSNAQQPGTIFPQCEIRDIDDMHAIQLMKECFLQWQQDAKLIDSPLLEEGNLGLYLSNGQAVIGIEQPVADGHHTRFEASLYTRSERSNCFARLVLDRRTPGRELQALLQTSALLITQMFYHRLDMLFYGDLHSRQQINEKEARHQDTMFQIAKRLHDQNDVSSVLQVLLQDLTLLYPRATVNLYLSQDHVNGDSRVKPLPLRNGAEDIYARSFLSAKPLLHTEDEVISAAIPMSGKQAVYGVLSFDTPPEHWDESDIKALVMLADTAGSAFENAKLFEQSNLLIDELQLINELTKRLNQSLRLNEVFDFAMTELLNIFKADYCNVLQLSKEHNQFQIVASNVPMAANETYTADYGFCGIINSTKEPLIISDYWTNRFVDSKLMDGTACRSLIAAPVMSGAEVIGVILVSHKNPNYFSYENYKLLQVLSTHIALAISNASLHAEVRRMVITDNLTGLYARHYLNEQIQFRQRKDPCGSLVLVDIDHFKKVNDTYGHLTGDSILVKVSEVIRSCIRDSDIAARWGGEELAVYLPQIRSMQAYRIAERIRSMVELHTKPEVTVSCGLSEWTFEEDKLSVESLFYRADMALYEAKNNGRNRIMIG